MTGNVEASASAIIDLTRNMNDSIRQINALSGRLSSRLTVLGTTFQDDGYETVQEYISRTRKKVEEALPYLKTVMERLVKYAELIKRSTLILDEGNGRVPHIHPDPQSLKNMEQSPGDKLSPYLPLKPEYIKQYADLVEQYATEADPGKKEQIRALSELLALENTLDLSDGEQNIPQLGGRYGKIQGKFDGQAHHMPPQSVSDDNKNDLPAIHLTTADHKMTSSYGVKMTMAYQHRLIVQINNGDYADVFRDQVYELKYLFGNKYDGGIRQAIAANRDYLQDFGNPRFTASRWPEKRLLAYQKLYGQIFSANTYVCKV